MSPVSVVGVPRMWVLPLMSSIESSWRPVLCTWRRLPGVPQPGGDVAMHFAI